MFKACIFDLDGTLLDTLPTIYHFCSLSLAHFHFGAVTMEQCRDLCRLPIAQFYPRLLQLSGCPAEKAFAVIEQFRLYDLETYLKDPFVGTMPFSGMEDLLKQLQNRGILTAVLTNKPAPLAEQVVSRFFPGLVDLAVGQTPDSISKPDPQSLLNLIESLALKRTDCLYVGDTDVDMQTAINAGVSLAAVSWGYQDIRSLQAYAPDFVISTPEELLRLF